jgi:hypothetical protein
MFENSILHEEISYDLKYINILDHLVTIYKPQYKTTHNNHNLHAFLLSLLNIFFSYTFINLGTKRFYILIRDLFCKNL